MLAIENQTTMRYKAHQIYHIFNQGNNREITFRDRSDYLNFLKRVRRFLYPNANILAYCLMPNHFHLQILPKPEGLVDSKVGRPIIHLRKPNFTPIPNTDDSPYQQVLSHQIGLLLSSYTKSINKKYNRSGSLWRSRTKSKDGWIEAFITEDYKSSNMGFHFKSEYVFSCFKYIHENPLKAGLVQEALDWEFSSAKDYAGLRNGTLCNIALGNELGLR